MDARSPFGATSNATADGALWAIMTGTGEWQFVLFALAIGLSEVRAGLVSTVPLFIGRSCSS